MSLLKTDINSFEIETLLAPKDYRLYRLSFSCESKANYLACKNLFDRCENEEDVNVLSDKAIILESVLKTVPSFYNIQIESNCCATCSYCPYPKFYKKKFDSLPSEKNQNRMSKENFKALVKKIQEFSGSAVVSLSLWGESLSHPDFLSFVEDVSNCKKLSLLIETDGLLVNEELCKNVKELIQARVTWIVSLDAVSDAMYKKMRGSDNLKAAQDSIVLLKKYFDKVYPQLVRTNETEEELEAFYRYWNNPENESGGKLIIQKYDYYSGKLEQKKVCDLSPLERNPCWHLRRDMNILFDGSVVPCKEYMFDDVIGNVFNDDLDTIWKVQTEYFKKDLQKDFPNICKDCDEYYTFNF